jgi:hypothetical protein
LNMGYRFAGGGCFFHGKQVQLNNHCPFHSLITHDDPTLVILNLTQLQQEPTPTYNLGVLGSNSIHSNVISNSFPLRC